MITYNIGDALTQADIKGELQRVEKRELGIIHRYHVILQKNNMPFYGFVCTSFSLEDWCQWNKYELVECLGKQPAKSYDQTDLL